MLYGKYLLRFDRRLSLLELLVGLVYLVHRRATLGMHGLGNLRAKGCRRGIYGWLGLRRVEGGLYLVLVHHLRFNPSLGIRIYICKAADLDELRNTS